MLEEGLVLTKFWRYGKFNFVNEPIKKICVLRPIQQAEEEKAKGYSQYKNIAFVRGNKVQRFDFCAISPLPIISVSARGQGHSMSARGRIGGWTEDCAGVYFYSRAQSTSSESERFYREVKYKIDLSTLLLLPARWCDQLGQGLNGETNFPNFRKVKESPQLKVDKTKKI